MRWCCKKEAFLNSSDDILEAMDDVGLMGEELKSQLLNFVTGHGSGCSIKTSNTNIVSQDANNGVALNRSSQADVPLTVEEALIKAPARMLANHKNRIQQAIAFIAAQVPQERRVPATSCIAVPILDRLKYLEDASLLKLFYLTLLAKSIDGDAKNDIHPAFVSIIEQLSWDEARLILALKPGEIQMTRSNAGYAPGKPKSSAAFYLPNIAPDVDAADVPQGLVDQPHKMKMYLSHLLSLNVIKIKPPPKVNNETQWLTWTICPSDFGVLFLSTCVPEIQTNPKA